MERPYKLNGHTYREVLGNGSRMYITINEHDGTPFEVFVRYDDPATYEWITALTTMITRRLRDGAKLIAIAEELLEIHGPQTGHMIPGTANWSPSLVARIGRTLGQHAVRANLATGVSV